MRYVWLALFPLLLFIAHAQSKASDYSNEEHGHSSIRWEGEMPFTPNVDEAILNQVQRDLFGETGKDGPLAKVGFELALLYRLYQDHLRNQGETPFVPPYSGMRLQDGYVLIDAIATSEAAALLTDLEALGFQDGTAFGRVVSGRVPILAIEKVAALPTLLSARAAMPAR